MLDISSKGLFGKILKDSTLSLIANFSNKISVVIIGIIVARILGVESFGKYAIIQSVVVMLANVVAQSISTSTAKHIAENINSNVDKVGKGITLTLVFSLFIGSGILCFALLNKGWFSANILFRKDLLDQVTNTVTIVFLTIIVGWFQGIFSGLGEFKKNAIINTTTSIIAIALGIILTMRMGLNGAILSIVITLIINTIISTWYLRSALLQRGIRLHLRGSLREANVITHVGLPILLTGIVVAPMTWFSNKLLSSLSNGLVELGTFAASMQWSAIFTQVSIVLGTVLIPMLASNKNNGSLAIEKANFYSGWIFTLIFSQPIIIFSDILCKIYGPSYDVNVFAVCIFFVIMSAVLTSFKSGLARKIVVLNLSWFSVISNIGWALLFVIISINTKKFGAIGITGAIFLSQLLHFAITMPYFLKRKIVPASFLFNIRVLILCFIPILCAVIQWSMSSIAIRLVLSLIIVILTIFLSLGLIKTKRGVTE